MKACWVYAAMYCVWMGTCVVNTCLRVWILYTPVSVCVQIDCVYVSVQYGTCWLWLSTYYCIVYCVCRCTICWSGVSAARIEVEVFNLTTITRVIQRKEILPKVFSSFFWTFRCILLTVSLYLWTCMTFPIRNGQRMLWCVSQVPPLHK